MERRAHERQQQILPCANCQQLGRQNSLKAVLSAANRLTWIKTLRGRRVHSHRVRSWLSNRGGGMIIANHNASLYDRIGGADAIRNLVATFYSKVIADPSLRPFFDHVGLNKLRRMQVEFFSAALDGPIHYTGRPVIHAHHGLHITRQHFQAFVEHLFETLARYPLSEDDRYAIISRINTYADDVIGTGTGPLA